ncbi:MAG: metallothionein [Planctomycetota bacterium]|nr:metallothionein [Planctomycetota bacterium]
MPQDIKCACPSCRCPVLPGKGVVRDGKAYCSRTCAYDCTPTTCVCVHAGCDEKSH